MGKRTMIAVFSVFAAFVVLSCQSQSTLREKLAIALDTSDFERIKSLVAKGIDLNADAKEFGGIGPLIRAVDTGNKELVDLLLKNGAKLETARYYNGDSVLSYAIQNQKYDIAKLLVENGAELNEKDSLGQTPLISVMGTTPSLNSDMWKWWEEKTGMSMGEIMDFIKLLIDKGSDLNASDDNHTKNTPLHYAIEKRHSDLARYMIEKGAGANNKKNLDGRTALMLAKELGLNEIAKMLKNSGAEE